MQKLFAIKTVLLIGGALLFAAGCVVGQQSAKRPHTVLHVFAYTPLQSATQKDFDEFKQATGEMVGKVPGLRRVWVGKLREPVPAENEVIRTFGVAMEFDNLQALNDYASNPIHREWERVYEKVRVRGTTTLDIVGE